MAVKMIFRRKEALEQKLFKMKYHKLLKTIADASSMASNKEKLKQVSSIYEENPIDPKLGIPQNTYMFDNMIKDTYNIQDSSSSEDENKNDHFLTKQERLEQVMEIYERKNPIKTVRVAEPSSRKIGKLDCID